MFSVKFKEDGSHARTKARLMAKCCTQTYGVDCSESFSPVAKVGAIRTLLALAAHFGCDIQQYDVMATRYGYLNPRKLYAVGDVIFIESC